MDYVESFYLSVGRYSCYFDCLKVIAEREVKKRFGVTVDYDLATIIHIASFHIEEKTKKSWLTFNYDDYNDVANFDVNYPTYILEMLSGLKWGMKRIDGDYKPLPNEYDVRQWKKNPTTTECHFNMSDYDSLQNSQTVKNGAIYGHRVFYVIE